MQHNQKERFYNDTRTNDETPNYNETRSNDGKPNYNETRSNDGKPNYNDRRNNDGKPNYNDRRNNDGKPNYNDRRNNDGKPNYNDRRNNDGKNKIIEFQKTFKHYQNLNNSLPEFIEYKLENMPCNKGYIWKGIHYYGLQPIDDLDRCVMFEKFRELLIIHEIEKDEHRIFHKHGRGKRELVSTTAIKRKQIQKII